MMLRVLSALRDRKKRERIVELVSAQGYVARPANSPKVLWDQVGQVTFDMVLLDLSMLSPSAASAVPDLRQLPGQPDIVVIDEVAAEDERAMLMAAGCLGILSPTLSDENLTKSLASLFEHRQAKSRLKLASLDTEEYRLGDFVSGSPSMKQLITMAKRVVASDTSVLILGQTGVGKESLARALHAEGPRSAEAFIPVNCAAIPEGLFESELFGHCQGAFSGATRDHRGHFEMAHKGTIFLDEIGELPLHLQVKLLRVLQDRKIQRVGSENSTVVDVRVLAATNLDPLQLIQAERLRDDLYYRIAVLTLDIPPLKDRQEDIEDLAENYFEIFNAKLGRHLSGIDPGVMDYLRAYAWPGNVRELINVMERAVILSHGPKLCAADFPHEIMGIHSSPVQEIYQDHLTIASELMLTPFRLGRDAAVSRFERQYLDQLMKVTRGRLGEAAQLAEMSTRTLHHKLKQLGLRKEDYRGLQSYRNQIHTE